MQIRISCRATKFWRLRWLLVASGILCVAAIGGCHSPSSPAPVDVLSRFQLGYRLLAAYPGFFWCDPDVYPVGREGQEQQNAIDQFAAIRANADEFSAILTHLGLPDRAAYSDGEKLAIYREHKKLNFAIQMTAANNEFGFVVRTGQNQGFRIEGTITSTGTITERIRQTSFNTCPVCLAKATLIATPGGDIPVELLRTGTTIWSKDRSGNMVAAKSVHASTRAGESCFRVAFVVRPGARDAHVFFSKEPFRFPQIVGLTAQGKPIDRRLPTDRPRRDVVKLKLARFATPIPVPTDERAAAFVTAPHVALHGCGNMPRCPHGVTLGARRCPCEGIGVGGCAGFVPDRARSEH